MNRPRGYGASRGLLLAALLVVLGAVASLPLFPEGVEPLAARTVVVLDLSASVRRPRPDCLAAATALLRDEAEGARARGESIAVVTFASSAATLFGPGDPRELLDRLAGSGGEPFDPRPPRGQDGASDLAGALELARAHLGGPERRPGRLALFTDGITGGTGARALLAALRVSSTHWAPLPVSTRPDGALLDVELPERVVPGAPLVVAVDLALVHPEPPEWIELRSEWLGPNRGDAPRTARVPVPKGAEQGTRWRVGLDVGPAPPGLSRLAVSLSLGGSVAFEAFPENNRRELAVLAGDLARAALLVPKEHRAAAAPWLDAARMAELGLGIERLEPAQFAARIGEFDLCISLGAGTWDLSPDALSSWIDRGGGWLGAFDARFLGLERDPRLAERAALLPAPPERPPRDVVMLVDASGSMAGEPFAALERAMTAVLDAVPAGDRVRVHFFTARLYEGIDLGGADERTRTAKRLLDTRPPSGPTALLAAAEDFVNERREVARPALAFLLSDGREEGDPTRPEERAAAVAQNLRELGVELVAVALGPERQLAPLEALAPGRVFEVPQEALASLAELLVGEISRERFQDQPLALDWSRGGDLARRVAGAAAPPSAVLRPMAAQLQPGAEAFLGGPDGEPVGAVARRGLGRVATLAGGPFDAVAEPAEFAPERLAALLAWLAERPSPVARATVLPGRDGSPELVVGGLDPALPAGVQAVLRDPAQPGRDLARVPLWAPSGPLGEGGLRERRGPWPPLDLAGGTALRVSVGGVPGPPLSVAAPLPLEQNPAPPVAALGPGDLPAAVPSADPPSGPHALAPWLVGAGLGLGVGALLLQRRERAPHGVQGPGQAVR